MYLSNCFRIVRTLIGIYFPQVTRRLLQSGASVVAVDAEGLTPALACAPNPAVARCLATILAAHGAYINLPNSQFLVQDFS